MPHSLKLDFGFSLFLIILVILYTYFFRHAPLSNDAYLYAMFSKEIAQGLTLHNDLPFASNGLMFYLTAVWFLLFGATTQAYINFNAIGFGLMVLGAYWLSRNVLNPVLAFIASLFIATFSFIPNVFYCFGVNPIMWALACILFAFQCQMKNKSSFYIGFLLGLAAIVREPFIIVALTYPVFTYISKQTSFSLKRFILGLAIALSITAILLTHDHSWHLYFFDMLHSGVDFRYKEGFFSVTRLHRNVLLLTWGFTNYYGGFIFLAILSYFLTAKPPLIQLLQKFLFPILLIEAILINNTITYSIVPSLSVAIILAMYFVLRLTCNLPLFILSIRQKGISRFILYRTLFIYILSLYIIINLIRCFPPIYRNYQEHYQSTFSEETKQTNDFIALINILPGKTLAGLCEYPILFQSKKTPAAHYPYLYDLFAPKKLTRPKLAEDQAKALHAQQVDLIAINCDGLSPLIKQIILQNYILIADTQGDNAHQLYMSKKLTMTRLQYNYIDN